MDDKITLDRDTFKALAVDSRVKILKILDNRQHTLTDLSEELEMAPSTIKEHLDTLVAAGLIKQVDKGMKWKYYKLTLKGKQVVNPYEQKVWIILATSLLALGFTLSSMFGKLGSLLNVPSAGPLHNSRDAIPATEVTNLLSQGTGGTGGELTKAIAGCAQDALNQSCNVQAPGAVPSLGAEKTSSEAFDMVSTTIARGIDNVTSANAKALEAVAQIPYIEIVLSLAFVLIAGVCIGYLIKKKSRI